MPVLSPRKTEFLLVVARRIVPAIADLPENEQAGIARVVDDALAARGKAMQVQFGLFLDTLRWASVLKKGRPLDKLPGEAQDEVLRRLEDSPVSRIRTGVWGLKTLVYMGYYGDPERAAQFGYTPSFDGNEKL